jgi:hypothetical protein
MIEWAGSALGVAGTLLRHFLDGPERKLRKEKLELEIRTLSAKASPILTEQTFQEFRQQVLAEIELLSAKLPDIKFGGGPSLTRKSDDAADAVARLSAAIADRRSQIDSIASNSDGQPEPQAPNGSSLGMGNTVDPISSDDEIEWTAPTEASTDETHDAASRIRSLSQRIEQRRRQDNK